MAHELEAYKALNALYNAEESAFYMRNNILVIIQIGMMAAMANLYAKSADIANSSNHNAIILRPLGISMVLLPFAGLIAAGAWLATIRRSAFIARELSLRLRSMESVIKWNNAAFRFFTTFDDVLCKRRWLKLENIRTSVIWTYAAIFFVVIWTSALLIALSWTR